MSPEASWGQEMESRTVLLPTGLSFHAGVVPMKENGLENEAKWEVKAGTWAFHPYSQNRIPVLSQLGSSHCHGCKGRGRVRGRVGGEGMLKGREQLTLGLKSCFHTHELGYLWQAA